MKIAALISGGVDSAVAVHRLLEQGHDVHLFYIRIGMDNDEGDCAAEEDIEMCRFIASRYALPFDVVELHKEYWDNVMEYALRTVREGLTPNPDIMCNKMIKFGFFEQRWGHEFDKTATGHYATTDVIDGKTWLATAVDPVKDQTDFLARISYEQISHLMFPIGDLPKAEVRRIAIETHMPNAYRKDSQGICFLGKINYNDFIRRHLGERPGPIVQARRTPRILVSHNRTTQRVGAERWAMVCREEEHSRQRSLRIQRLRLRKTIRPHPPSRRDALHNRKTMARRYFRTGNHVQEPTCA